MKHTSCNAHWKIKIPSIIHKQEYLCKNYICLTFNSRSHYLGFTIGLFLMGMDMVTWLVLHTSVNSWQHEIFSVSMYIIPTQELETSIYKIFCFHLYTTVLQQKFILQIDLWVQSSNYYSWIYSLRSLANTLHTFKQIKAPTAIQESIIYLYFNQKPNNDMITDT